MAEPFNEDAFRAAVDMWWNNPDRATTHRILTGARHALVLLDEARADLENARAEADAARRNRNAFAEEIRDLNDQIEQLRGASAQCPSSAAERMRAAFRRASDSYTDFTADEVAEIAIEALGGAEVNP